jgi:nicotinate-nucleotide adenylyltransferase
VTSLPSAIGIFGGTFDPPHLGHLILAETACDRLNLSQVLFVPAADPPHKNHKIITPIEHRLAMLAMAIEGNPRFAISRVDIDRPGPHYTADTLELLCQAYPKAELYFLMGGDSLRDLASWHDPNGIVSRARIAVMRRPGSAIDLSALAVNLPGVEDRITFVDAPSIGISATSLRECLRAEHSIRYQVPAEVEQYIETHQLYRDSNHD